MNDLIGLLLQTFLGGVLSVGFLCGIWLKTPGKSYYRRAHFISFLLAALLGIGFAGWFLYHVADSIGDGDWRLLNGVASLAICYYVFRAVFAMRLVARYHASSEKLELPMLLIHEGQKLVRNLIFVLTFKAILTVVTHVGMAYLAMPPGGAVIWQKLFVGFFWAFLLYFALSRLINIIPWRFAVAISSFTCFVYGGAALMSAVYYFIEIGWLPNPVPLLWDTTALLSVRTRAGNLAYHLVGYRSSPSLTEIFSYLLYLSLIWIFEYKQKTMPLSC